MPQFEAMTPTPRTSTDYLFRERPVINRIIFGTVVYLMVIAILRPIVFGSIF